MKYILRVYLFNTFALLLVKELFPALLIEGGVLTVLFAGIVLTILMLVVKPVLKILLIPINFITFGLANWCINVVILYLLTLILPEVIVRQYVFPGLSWQGFVIPSMELNYLMSLFIVSVSLTLFAHILHGVSEA